MPIPHPFVRHIALPVNAKFYDFARWLSWDIYQRRVMALLEVSRSIAVIRCDRTWAILASASGIQ